jgi:hypothetical protein
MNYYRLHDKNSSYPDRWYLGSPITDQGDELDARVFLAGQPVPDVGPLSLPITRSGAAQEFTMGDFDMPVLATSFVDELRHVAPDDSQSIPVTVKGEEREFSIINVLHVIRCLDESRSTVVRWPDNATVRDLAGTYLTVSDIHIDPAKVGTANMFRIAGWLAALIVSEPVGAVLADATGVVLERV